MTHTIEAAVKDPPILITGTHYSGTTWVGRVLAHGPRVAYLHEPFNPQARPGICRARFPRWYTYLSDENFRYYEPALRETFAFRYSIWRELEALGGIKDIARMMRDAANFARWRLLDYRPLIKDPVALLSAERLHVTFGMRVVVMVRHPAAFALSMKRRHARHPFSDFLDQPLLMKGPLAGHAEQIRAFAKHEHDVVDQAGLLWRTLVDAALRYHERHPDWLFIRHECLACDPEERFRMICEHVDLPFTKRVRRAIVRTTAGRNPTEARRAQPKSHFRRDTRAIIDRWKHELSAKEIDRVRAWTEPTASAFYADENWKTPE